MCLLPVGRSGVLPHKTTKYAATSSLEPEKISRLHRQGYTHIPAVVVKKKKKKRKKDEKLNPLHRSEGANAL